MNNKQLISFRGEAKLLSNFNLEINNNIHPISFDEKHDGQYNIRVIIEQVSNHLSFQEQRQRQKVP